MKAEYDAIVIGAGYHGLSCAYFLSKAGASVLLIDSGQVGGGASGANFGNVQVQDCTMGLSYDLTLAGYERMKTMEQELGTSIGYRSRGSMLVAEKKEYLPALEASYREKKEAGLPVTWLEGDALLEKEPNLTSGEVLAACYCDEGNVYPFRYHYALMDKGVEHGLTVAEYTPVASILIEGGRCRGICLTDGRTVRAEHVVVSAGAGSKALCRTAGLNIPVETVKAEAYATEPLGPFILNYYSSAGFFAEAHTQERAAVSLCISQSHYGNLLITETSKPYGKVDPAYHDCTSDDHLKRLTQELVRIFPMLRGIQVIRSWVASSPYTDDTLPYFGKSPVEGLILATGFKSSVVVSGVVGETVRDLVMKDTCRFDLSEFTDRIEWI